MYETHINSNPLNTGRKKSNMSTIKFLQEEYNALCQWAFDEHGLNFAEFICYRNSNSPSPSRFFSITDSEEDCEMESELRQEQIHNSETLSIHFKNN